MILARKTIPLTLLLIVFLAPFPSNGFSREIDLIVEKIQNTYQKAHTWQAEFNQSTFVELWGRKIHKKGNISVKKPGKIRIEYKKGKRYLSNGKKLWIYTPQDSQVEVYSKLSKRMSHEALIFLQGFGQLKKKSFSYFPMLRKRWRTP